ncbi:MAG: glycosyltransferase family 4 protein [Phycisphaerae bacterium]
MIVGLVMERIEPWRGGAETSTKQFVQHLIKLGVKLEVVTRSRLPSTPSMHVHTLKANGATRAGRSAAFARAARQLLARAQVDLMHAVSPCVGADVYQPRGGTVVETVARNLALRSGPTGRSIKRLANRFNRRQRLMLDLERQLLGPASDTTIIALSDYVVRQLTEHYDVPLSRIRKIFNGVDDDSADDATRSAHRKDIRRAYGVSDDALLVLLVAHNFKLKGVGRWLEALARLRESPGPEIQSLVVGKDHPVRWQRQAASLGVGDRVQFVGSTKRVQAFYHAADVLVHPTYYDPCSRVVLEGMVSGLPCITTGYDGSSEQITDGVNGLVLPEPGDVAGLADRVQQICDAELRRRLGGQARRVIETASMHGHARQVVALYQELAGRRATI